MQPVANPLLKKVMEDISHSQKSFLRPLDVETSKSLRPYGKG